MRRISMICLFVFFPGLLFSVDMSNRIGIGYNGSIDALSIKFFFKNTGLEVAFGFNFEAKNEEDFGDEASLVNLRGSSYFFYPFDLTDKANINLFAGADIDYIGSHVQGDGGINIYGRAGISPEIFLFEKLSVETSFGLLVSIFEEVNRNVSGSRFRIDLYGDGISIIGGLSFHWYIQIPLKKQMAPSEAPKS